MGSYGIYGADAKRATSVRWLNLPTRNLFYDLLDDAGESSNLWTAVAARCSDDACFVFDEAKFESVCNGMDEFLKNHKDWLDEKRLARGYREPDHWGWARDVVDFFLKVCSKGYDPIVFYDNLEIHDCHWPEEFAYLPLRRDVTNDLGLVAGAQ